MQSDGTKESRQRIEKTMISGAQQYFNQLFFHQDFNERIIIYISFDVSPSYNIIELDDESDVYRALCLLN